MDCSVVASTLAFGLKRQGVQVVRARGMTMSSWRPGGALVLTFAASLMEYSKASSSSIASGQMRGVTASAYIRFTCLAAGPPTRWYTASHRNCHRRGGSS